jgi:hypothetical protein
MISLKSRLEILFDNQQDRTDLEALEVTQRTTILRRLIRETIETSSALGIAELEQETLELTPDQMTSGTPVTFDLLQVTRPISIRATCTRYGGPGSNYVTVLVKVNLSATKASYTVEHPICETYVDNVSLPRLYKRLERILKDIPSIVAPLLAE